MARLYIPTGVGAVVQFEPFSGSATSYANFLKVEFMPEGDVRIDDDEHRRFGRFPTLDAFFLSVNLNITPANATARVALLGRGASGTFDVSVDPRLAPLARRFGSIRFWMGYQPAGAFSVDDIVVTRRNE